MEPLYPNILLAGYRDDVEIACAKLAGYSGKIYRADENTIEVPETWNGAIVAYIFSRDTGYSSQLRSIFVFLHDHLKARNELVLLRERGVAATVFSELESLPRAALETVRERVEILVGLA